ncbi:MAG: hypothetical protein H7296_05605 [Bacteroidia bacterium]|nr:hypothetical protein [Bacteroidia bacterium]
MATKLLQSIHRYTDRRYFYGWYKQVIGKRYGLSEGLIFSIQKQKIGWQKNAKPSRFMSRA